MQTTFEVPTIATVLAVLKARVEYNKKRLRVSQSWIDETFGPIPESHDNYKHSAFAANRVAGEIINLLSAIKAGRSVFFRLVKHPKGGLEKGRNWYDLYYVTTEGRICKFWPSSSEFATALGMDENNRDTSMSKWLFSSGAIGMDRLLDATGTFANVLGMCAGYEPRRSPFQFTHSDCI